MLTLNGPFEAKLFDKSLLETSRQRDLGLMITHKLSWAENCVTRVQKATKAFCAVKRNISSQIAQ